MKRAALVAIPLIALAAALLMLILRRPAATDAAPAVGPPFKPGRVEPPPPPPGETRVAAPCAISVTVLARGGPVEGARVTLAGKARFTGTTGSKGRSEIAVQPGRYDISVRHPRYVPADGAADAKEGTTANVRIDLREGGAVFGTVTGEGGIPVAGVKVSILDPGTKHFSHPDLEASTDAAGAYRIEGIPAQAFGLHARHARHKPWMQMSLSLRHPTDLLRVDIPLEPGRSVSGRVVDEAGVPVEGASVIASNETAAVVKSDPEGRFEVTGLGDQPVNLSASAPGFGTIYRRRLPPGSTEVEMRLPRGGRITGRVTAAPPPGWFAVILSRFDEEIGKVQRVKTETVVYSGAGEFSLKDVTPGAYWIDVEARGYGAANRPQILIRSGQTVTDVEVKLEVKR